MFLVIDQGCYYSSFSFIIYHCFYLKVVILAYWLIFLSSET